MPEHRTSRAALLISYSNIETDPRVRRQIDWVRSAGWEVDTLGLGGHPSPDVRRHFRLKEPSTWTTTRPGQALIHLVFPTRLQFYVQMRRRVPSDLDDLLVQRAYDVIVFNEFEFIPWVTNTRHFDPERTHLHLDMHEYREPGGRGRSRWGRLTRRNYRWARRHIGARQFASRSTVARGIAALYEREFDFAPMAIVRNIPRYVEQTPSPVTSDQIRMLFHGMAGWSRGLPQIVEAMRGLDQRFTMAFMLTQPQSVIDRLSALIETVGVGDRVEIVPPSPMREIATRINEFDLEVIFYPPVSTNVELALPNKIFEAVQGRLGLVIGNSPMLRDVVDQYGNGIVVDGWSAEDLRAALAALSQGDVERLKHASDIAAHDLNAEREGKVFLNAIDAS